MVNDLCDVIWGDLLEQSAEDILSGEIEDELTTEVDLFNEKDISVSLRLHISDLTIEQQAKGGKPKIVNVDIELPKRELIMNIDREYGKRRKTPDPKVSGNRAIDTIEKTVFTISLQTTDAIFAAMKAQKTGTAILNSSIVLRVLDALTPEEVTAIDDQLNMAIAATGAKIGSGRQTLKKLLATLAPSQFYMNPTMVEIAKLYILDKKDTQQ